MQADPPSTSGRDEGISVSDKALSRKNGGPAGAGQGPAYTWEDGDRTLTVYLQTDLVVEQNSDGLPRDVVAAEEVGDNVVRRVEGQAKSNTLPVFHSESGELLTLPGGVLLVIDPEWSQAQVNSFFSDNGIKRSGLSELSYADNGFFIDTEPGFPSLDLANQLAALEGVEVSSPNWGREATPK